MQSMRFTNRRCLAIFAFFIVGIFIFTKQMRQPVPTPKPQVPINCKKVVSGDAQEQNAALQRTLDGSFKDEYYCSMKSCATFLTEHNYITRLTSTEETAFPLAFSIMVFKDVGQFDRLLRAIYRPQNAYCIHIDRKATPRVRRGFENIASCFTNVYISQRSVDVQWGRFSLLEADLICMKELLNRHKSWKYLFNLAGQEFPLRTNWELVRILKVFNGSNDVEGTIKYRNSERIPKENPGFNMTWVKGNLHITASRAFVDYMFNDPRAIRILDILRKQETKKDRFIPDEQFFATLDHNPQLGTPGAFVGKLDNPYYPYVTRFVNWKKWPCQSELIVRDICIFGVKDLPFITKRGELFVNKLYSHFQPYALNCLEEWLWHKIETEIQRKGPTIDLDFYKKRSFVKYHQ